MCVDLHSMICCWKFGGFLSKHKFDTYHAKALSSVVILGSLFDVGGTKLLLHFDYRGSPARPVWYVLSTIEKATQ